MANTYGRWGAWLMIATMACLGVVQESAAARPGAVAQTRQRTAQNKFEIQWMQRMIDHHHMAVMLAELAETNAVHPMLQSAATEMVAAQTAEIEQLQLWLAQWYGVVYEPRMKPSDQNMLGRLSSLPAERFEVVYMEMMTRHHLQAIRESLLALLKAQHSELKELAVDMIDMQAAEVREMRAWLCNWYNRCNGPDIPPALEGRILRAIGG